MFLWNKNVIGCLYEGCYIVWMHSIGNAHGKVRAKVDKFDMTSRIIHYTAHTTKGEMSVGEAWLKKIELQK